MMKTNTNMALRALPVAMLLFTLGAGRGAHAQAQAQADGVAVSAPTSAVREDVTAEARARFARGQELTQSGRFSEALVEFEIGYGMTRRPLFLFNMAECARSLGDFARARSLYERYLSEDTDATLAATARQRLAALPQPPPGAARDADVVITPDEVARHSSPSGRPRILESPTRPREADDDDDTIFEAWPFWVGVGALVATAVTLGVVVSSSGSEGVTCGAGCLDFRNP